MHAVFDPYLVFESFQSADTSPNWSGRVAKNLVLDGLKLRKTVGHATMLWPVMTQEEASRALRPFKANVAPKA